MAKKRKKIGPVHPGQQSLFDLVIKSQETFRQEAPDEGSLNVRDRLRISLNYALKKCPSSRWEVAGKMGHLLGVEISKYQIDGWTAESKNGHRMPAEYVPAFCTATGNLEPLRILAEAAGLFCLQGPDALRSEIRKLDEEAKKVQTEKRKRVMFLREMEGKQKNNPARSIK